MFERISSLIGQDKIDLINKKRVVVIGLGGVGSYVCEMLARNGILDFIIVDSDKIDETNKNRQIIALNSTIDRYKTDVVEERLLDINENIKVKKITEKITKDNINLIFDNDFDYLIDCIDMVTTKINLIVESKKRNINIVSSMGTGKKLNPYKLKITDISKTKYDKIAKVIRKKLKEYNIYKDVCVLSSDEEVIDTGNVIGSYSIVTSISGILIADYVIKDIIK